MDADVVPFLVTQEPLEAKYTLSLGGGEYIMRLPPSKQSAPIPL